MSSRRSRIPLVGLVLGLTGPALAAAGPSAPSASVAASGSEIHFRGRIDDAAAKRFVALLDAAPRPVVITSVGGDEFASLDMAEAILRHGVPVRAEKYCLSGCANAVLVAGRERTIAPDTIVGLHGSSVASLARYRAAKRQPPAGVIALVRRYERLYAARGASLDLLTCAAEQIGLGSELQVEVDPASGETRQGWPSRYTFWLPSPDDLKRFGVAVLQEGTFPTTDASREQLLRKVGFRSEAKVRWSLHRGACR